MLDGFPPLLGFDVYEAESACHLKGGGIDLGPERRQAIAAGLAKYGSTSKKGVKDQVARRCVRLEQDLDELRRELARPWEGVASLFAINI